MEKINKYMLFSRVWKKTRIASPLINILTRTSNRPKGFKKCYTSIQKQSYRNLRHIIAYDQDRDLEYLSNYNLDKMKMDKLELINSDDTGYSNTKLYSPHNLYCNYLLNEVKEGWVMFLDDDDMLANRNVLKKLFIKIQKNDDDTLFLWQMQYPDGNVLPGNELMRRKEIKIGNIGSPCFLVHSKYAKMFSWDSGKCADFRYLEKVFNQVPKKVWISEPLVKLNNFGDLGARNDITTC